MHVDLFSLYKFIEYFLQNIQLQSDTTSTYYKVTANSINLTTLFLLWDSKKSSVFSCIVYIVPRSNMLGPKPTEDK